LDFYRETLVQGLYILHQVPEHGFLQRNKHIISQLYKFSSLDIIFSKIVAITLFVLAPIQKQKGTTKFNKDQK